MARSNDVRDLVATVRDLDVSADYIRYVIEQLTAIGSSALGYRNTGTPEDVAVADFVKSEMQAIGLSDPAVETVSVDAWRFRSAQVQIQGEPITFTASSFGGIPGTPADGITARLVDAGDPTRARLDGLDLNGCIALVDWTNKRVHPSVFVLELARRGVRGLVLCCPPGGAWFQGDGALGAFDGHWPRGAPPMVMITQGDAALLRERDRAARRSPAPIKTPLTVTLSSRVDITPATLGRNVVGYLRGPEPGPVVVGAHHDAWFRGAFDNTSGVAAMLAMARSLVAAGHIPCHTICFTSRTAEEYGRLDKLHDWCIGAWEQIATVHPDWADSSPFHLCVEASGHPDLRTIVEAPVEYRAWARAGCRAAEAEGWTPTGWRVAPPVAGTEQWPYLLKGVPGVATYAWETSFADTDYHTQRDTAANVDNDFVARQSRLYLLLLLDADRRPDAIVDHRARARELTRIAQQTNHGALASAARRHGGAQGRPAFTAVGRHLHALDAGTVATYPHEQVRKDLTALNRALDALDRGDARAAALAAGKVGSNRLHRYLSKEALQTYLNRLLPDAVAGSWGSASHLTHSPNLWDEITALTALDPAASGSNRAALAEVRRRLEHARDAAQRALQTRLDDMAQSLDPSPTRG